MARSDDTPRRGFLRSVLTDGAFWLGLGAIVLAGLLSVVLFNYAVMPLYTRHDATVQVPDLRELSPSQAERALRQAGLEAVQDEQPYNPNVTADVVMDQAPSANTAVKPGRRVYYYINAAPRELVEVPRVLTLAEGRARPAIEEAGLAVGAVRIDTLRTPFESTVTRQLPDPGRRVPQGTRVQLWISPGVGTTRVSVPDVVGLTPEEARARIFENGLWVDSPEATGERVLRQEPAHRTAMFEGEEVQIYTDEE